MRTDFRLRSFRAEWGFLARDKRKHERMYLTVKNNTMDFAGKEYVPQKNDPFVFTSWASYESTLNTVKSLSERLDKVVAKWHAEDLSDPVRLKSYLAHSPADREALNFLAAEADILRKFTIQRLVRPFWYVDGFAATNVPVQPVQERVLDAFMKYMTDTVKNNMAHGKHPLDPEDMSDPLETNAGAPIYTSGPAAKLQLANDFAGSFKNSWMKEQHVRLDELSPMTLPTTLASAVMKVSSKYKVPPSVVFSVGANRRYGPNRKWQPLYIPTGTDVIASMEVQNLPRVRNVYMAPYIFNVGLSPIVAVMKSVRKTTLGWWSDTDMMIKKEAELNRRWNQSPNDTYVLESDFSGFDRSISLTHRRHMLTRIASAFPNLIPSTTVTLADQHANLSYIIPDFTDIGNNFAALECIPSKPVGLYSGLKLTSEIGSYIAMWATLTLLHVGGIISLDDIASGKWNKGPVFFENQGDDGKFTIKGSAITATIASLAQQVYGTFGLKVTFAIGSRFLMRHYIKARNFPVLARILQQTISNEHIKDNAAIFTLGFLARTMGYVSLKKELKRIASACSSDLSTEITNYVSAVEDLIASLRLNPVLKTALNTDDPNKLNQISKLAQFLPEAKVDGGSSLLALIEAERFSATGRELLAALSATDAQKLLDATAKKERELFLMTCDKLKFNIFDKR